jgi:hypothetical protein
LGSPEDDYNSIIIRKYEENADKEKKWLREMKGASKVCIIKPTTITNVWNLSFHETLKARIEYTFDVSLSYHHSKGQRNYSVPLLLQGLLKILIPWPFTAWKVAKYDLVAKRNSWKAKADSQCGIKMNIWRNGKHKRVGHCFSHTISLILLTS